MMRAILTLFFLAFAGSACAMTGSTYDPSTFEFETSKIVGDAQGVAAVCVALGTTNIDLTLTDDEIMTGAILVVSGASLGDYLDLQVMAGPTVVATPIRNWYLPNDGSVDFQMVVPKKILAGLKLRVVVHTTVLLVTPYVAVNFKLWKTLQ